MPLYNSYVPTYSPSSQDQSPPSGSPLQNPLYSSGMPGADYMSAAFNRSQAPGANQPDQYGTNVNSMSSVPGSPQTGYGMTPMSGGNPFQNMNFSPTAGTPWANPGAHYTGQSAGVGGSATPGGFGGSMDHLGPKSTPIYDFKWNNPLDPVTQLMGQNTNGFFNYGSSAPGITPHGGTAPGSAYGPGPQISGRSNPQSDYQAAMYGQEAMLANGAAQSTPGFSQAMFQAATPQQLQGFNPYAVQSAFSQAAQNYSNAFANPNFKGGNTTGMSVDPNYALQGTGTHDQNYFDQGLNGAYHGYINAMNNAHLF